MLAASDSYYYYALCFIFCCNQTTMLTGNIVALITPMLENGDVDFCSLKNLVEYHIRSHTRALAILGTTGESCAFDLEEHVNIVKQVIEFADGRIDIIASTGANCTDKAIRLSQALQQIGVVAGLCVTPYYNKPSQEGLFRHYQAITSACDLPQLIYNVPSRTCCDISDEVVVRLSELNGIIGLKDATGDLTRFTRLQPIVNKQFIFLSGDDKSGCEFILQGGHGVISVTSNVAATQMSNMCQQALAGNAQQARQINVKLAPLHEALFIESNPIPVKWACKQLNLIKSAQLRLPLIELDPQYHAQLQQALTFAASA